MGEQLKWALTNGDLEFVKAEVNKEEDANRKVDSQRQPLHLAADFGQKEVVDYLISLGAEVNAVDVHGITPLLYATYEGHISVVKTLLDVNADKNMRGPDGLLPIESTDCELIKALLK